MWERSKTEYDYARFFPEWAARDVASWIRRDRNCPSVILWSIGNEIYDTHADARGLQVTKMLHELVRQHDPKGHAPTTIGSNYMMGEGAQRCADVVKLAGYNYAERLYDPHHAAHPDWVIYGSETGSVVQSRGIYHFPLRQPLLADDDLQCSALGNSATSWGARNTEACILADENTPYSAGQFIWTGTDYIGEPTPYHTRNSYFGQVDTAGFEKDSFYIFQSAWTDWQAAPMVHVFPYWDFSPGQPIDVRVCSNAPEVELFAGGQSLGRRRLGIAENKLVADYQLPYAVGTLRAVAYDPQGNIIAQQARSSFSDAVQLKLQAEETTLAADGQSLAFLTVSAVDVAGNPVENASNRVQVQVRGAGRLVGLDNGDSTDTDPYKGHTKNLFSGKLLAVVAATLEAGDVEVIVSTPGLKGASITLTSKPAPQAPGSSRTLMSSRPDLDRPGLETFIPVRKVELRQAGDFALTPERPSTRIRATIFPANASDQSLLWDVTNAAGIPSNIATLAVEGHEAVLTAIGDGEVWLRCMSRSGADHVRLIAQLCFTVSGMGTPFLDPYGFISGGLYTSSSAELTNGNERGIATPRDEESYVTFAGIDFGPYGADTITLPLFSLTAEPFPIEIWEGIPGETGSEHLCTVTYTSGSIWNTYQAETYTLPRRLTGVKALSFVLRQKVHIKGFSFQRAEKAFARLAAGEHDALYGDDYTVSGSRVEAIGNNVTLRFEGMDFTRDVPDTVTIWGRTPLAGNTIHLRLWHREEEHAQAVDTAHILEFAHAEAYTAQTFALRGVKPGVYDVEFVFLPGSRFDFEAFQMGRSKKE